MIEQDSGRNAETVTPSAVSAPRSISSGPRIMSPVLQFALLLAPIVMSCFFLVYALTGWVLDAHDRLNWSIEAAGVAGWVGCGIVLYSVLTGAYARLRGAGWTHPLILSGLFHSVLAVVLIVSILDTSQL